MQDYLIQRSSRKCHLSDRPLEPGERYISAIVQKGADLVRRDFSRENWTGANEDTIAWWVAKIPNKRVSPNQLAPVPVLLDTLSALLEKTEQGKLAYLLGLMLVRKRILQEDESELDNSNNREDRASSKGLSVVGAQDDYLRLKSSSDDRQFWIPVPSISADESKALQAELIALLYSEE